VSEAEAIQYAQKVFSVKYTTLQDVKELHKKSVGLSIWNIVIDISDFYSLISYKTDNDGIRDSLNVAFAILNVAAHYKHYILKTLKQQSKIFIYNSSDNHYEEVEKTLSTLCDLFDDIYYVYEQIEGKHPFIPLYYFITVMSGMNRKTERVINISHNRTSCQLLRIDPHMLNIDYKGSLTEGKEYFFNNDKIFKDNSINKSISLIPLFISIFGMGVFGHMKVKKSFESIISSIQKKAVKMGIGFASQTNKVGELLEDCGFEDNEIEAIIHRLKYIDVNENAELFGMMKKMVMSKTIKVKSNNTFNLNDYMENKDGYSLNVNWLMEK
jgi:hypothetical protein